MAKYTCCWWRQKYLVHMDFGEDELRKRAYEFIGVFENTIDTSNNIKENRKFIP